MTEGLWRSDRTVTLVAVTGGPCSGKSTLMAKARQWLEDRGIRVAIQPEVATEFITAGLPPWGKWQDPLDFQRHILSYMLMRESIYTEMLRGQATDRPLVLLCDRGVCDAIAYIGRVAFAQIATESGMTLMELLERYRAVVHLVTAADGAEDFYTLANNAARMENPEEARALDTRTMHAWIGHQHHYIVDNSTSFEAKVVRALTHIARSLGMKGATEKERKWLHRNWHPSMVPEGIEGIAIVQTYLVEIEPGTERRVRMRSANGVSSYYYTEKADTDRTGERIEREEEIDERRYHALLREQHPATAPVRKTRYGVRSFGHLLEVDVYEQPSGLVTVEAEVADMGESVMLPSGWDLTEVTGDPQYKNRKLAEQNIG